MIPLQISHWLHGLPSTGERQFTAREKIFATDVLPVPRVPQKRYACPIRLLFTVFFNIVTTLLCSTTSSKVIGLHFL